MLVDPKTIEYSWIKKIDQPKILASLFAILLCSIRTLNYLQKRMGNIGFIIASSIVTLIFLLLIMPSIQSFFTTKSKLEQVTNQKIQDTKNANLTKEKKKLLWRILGMVVVIGLLFTTKLIFKVLAYNNKKFTTPCLIVILVLTLLATLTYEGVLLYKTINNINRYRNLVDKKQQQGLTNHSSSNYRISKTIISIMITAIITVVIQRCLEDTIGFAYANNYITFTTFIACMGIVMLLGKFLHNFIITYQYYQDINKKYTYIKDNLPKQEIKCKKKHNRYMIATLVLVSPLCFALSIAVDYVYKNDKIFFELEGIARDAIYIILLFIAIVAGSFCKYYVVTSLRRQGDDLLDIQSQHLKSYAQNTPLDSTIIDVPDSLNMKIADQQKVISSPDMNGAIDTDLHPLSISFMKGDYHASDKGV